MTTKYQQHYNQILTGTLTNTIMKSISYQANIKLANEIIADQEKTIADLNTKIETNLSEMEKLKSNKLVTQNNEVSLLQKRLDDEVKNTIRLNNEVNELKTIRNQYENVKNQVTHIDTFKNELVKSREETENVKKYYEKTIQEMNGDIEQLNQRIEYLQLTPAKRKKIDELNTKSENTLLSSTDTKDGGSF